MHYKYKLLDIVLLSPDLSMLKGRHPIKWIIRARSIRRKIPGTKRCGYYHLERSVQDSTYQKGYPKRESWEDEVLERVGCLSIEEALVHSNEKVREVALGLSNV